MKHRGSLLAVDLQTGGADAAQPLYVRLQDRFREAIRSGALAPGMRLPSARTLALDLGLGRNSIDRALDQLTSEGYIVRRRGSGSFVAAALPERDEPPAGADEGGSAAAFSAYSALRSPCAGAAADFRPNQALPFTPAAPALELFPRQLWARLLQRAARRAGNTLWGFGPPAGLPELRRAIAAHANSTRGVRCTADQVVVVTSANQALHLAATMLAKPGATAWVEEVTSPAAVCAIELAGLHAARIPLDADGLDVTAGGRLAESPALVRVTPSHQDPLGTELSLARRSALAAYAASEGALVVEDEYDGDYRYEGRPLAALQSFDRAGRVIYVGAFDKIMFPGLRLAYAVLPPGLVAPFVAAKETLDGPVSPMVQAALAAFITEGHLAEHLRRTRLVYQERREALLAEARTAAPLFTLVPSSAGMHLAGTFTRPVDDREVAQYCRRAGVQVVPLSAYGPAAPSGLVLGFACTSPSSTRAAFRVLRRGIVQSLRGAAPIEAAG